MNVDQIRASLNDTLRDSLTEDYQLSALKTAMQCLTGAAGANNVPADFCERQLNKQRSVNWAVLPDKPSPIDGSVRPFADHHYPRYVYSLRSLHTIQRV